MFVLCFAYNASALAPFRSGDYHRKLVDENVRVFEGPRWQVLRRIVFSQFFQEFEVYFALAEALIEKGEIEKADRALHMAEIRLGETDPLYFSWRVEKLIDLSGLYESIGKGKRAQGLLDQACGILDAHPEISAYSRLKNRILLGKRYREFGRMDVSRSMFDRALTVAGEISDVPLRVETLFEAASSMNAPEEAPVRKRFFEEGRRTIDTVDSVFHRCFLLCDSAEIEAAWGRPGKARADLEKAIALSRDPRILSFYRTEMLGRIMEVYQAWGETVFAAQMFSYALEEADAVQIAPENGQSRMSLAKVSASRGAYLFTSGDRENGRFFFRRAAELAENLDRRGDREEVFAELLEKMVEAGAFEEAAGLLELALRDINIRGYPMDPDNTLLPVLSRIFDHLSAGENAWLASRIEITLLRIMALVRAAEKDFEKHPERAWKRFGLALQTAGTLEKQAEKPAAHTLLMESMARAGVFDDLDPKSWSALLHWWELGIENEAYFNDFMKRFDPEDPLPAFREALFHARLTRIEMSESGNAFQNCPGAARNMVRQAALRGAGPETPPGNPPLPGMISDGKSLSSMGDLLEGYRLMRVMGRTAVYRSERDGSYRAVKFLLREEDPELLTRENRWMEYLARNRERLGLKGYYPRPLKEGEARYFEVLSLPGQLERDFAAQKKKNGERFVLARPGGRCRFIAYDVDDPDYFRYVNEPGVDKRRMLESMRRNLYDLGVLARFGILHTSLIELFHNEEPHRQAHPDGGRYIWMVDLVRPMLREGAGRIHAYPEAVRFPNYRLSGPADFAEIALSAEMLRNDHPKSRHLDNNLRRFQTAERTLLTQMAFSGDILLSAALVYGLDLREEDRWRWDDEESLASAARDLESLFEAFVRGYRGADPGFVSPLSRIDWRTLARQMAFFMGRGEPYAGYMQNGNIPEIIFGRGVEVGYPDDLNAVRNWVDSLDRNGFYSNGTHPDLGVMNGPNPLQELVRALYLTTASLVTPGPGEDPARSTGGVEHAGAAVKMLGRAA